MQMLTAAATNNTQSFDNTKQSLTRNNKRLSKQRTVAGSMMNNTTSGALKFGSSGAHHQTSIDNPISR